MNQEQWEKELSVCLYALRDHNGDTLHMKPGSPPRIRMGSQLEVLSLLPPIKAAWTEKITNAALSETQKLRLSREHFLETSLAITGMGRMRARFFQQRGSIEIVVRLVREGVPTLASLNLPMGLKNLHNLRSGLVVVAAPAGCGKSTSIAAMIHHLNRYRPCHIVCIDDPTEFIHRPQIALVDQIEVGRDTQDQNEALKNASRQDADVVVLENPADAPAVEQILHLAETGHLVLVSIPVRGPEAVYTWLKERLAPKEAAAFRERLLRLVELVLLQTLAMRNDQSNRILVSELLMRSEALSRRLLGTKDPLLEEFELEGTFDGNLIHLAKDGTIPWSEATYHAIDKAAVERAIIFE